MSYRNILDALVPRMFAAAALFVLLAAVPLHAAERFGEGVLWRVEGKGAPASHVFGTIHLADPRVTALPPAVTAEFKRSATLVTEADLSPSSIASLVKLMVYADGRNLEDVAGERLFRQAAGIVTALGLPPEAARVFKPWAMMLLVSMPKQDPEKVLDFVLARMAAEQGKKLLHLETMEEQVAVFESMSESDQVELLRHAVLNHDQYPKIIERMIGAYLKRDLAGMWRISMENIDAIQAIAGSDAESGAGAAARRNIGQIFVQRLLHDRNTRMAQGAEARLKEGGAFIAVGALHLYGDTGVLAQLEKRGWRLTKVY